MAYVSPSTARNPFTKNRPTRTDGTEKDYLQRVRTMHKQAGLSGKAHATLLRVAEWFATVKAASLVRASVRKGIAALKFFAWSLRDPDEAKIVELLDSIDLRACKRRSTNTSSPKAKWIPVKEFERLADTLVTRGRTYDRDALYWLSSGMMTGLRPIEWLTAELVTVSVPDECAPVLALRVRNAKWSNGRAHGKCRHVRLDDLKDSHMQIIKHHLERVAQVREPDAWKTFYNGCRDALRTIRKDLYPRGRSKNRRRGICLYTGRHQFKADLKASGLDDASIAAVMGHSNDRTAGDHYAPQRKGRSVRNMKALPEEKRRVRQKNHKNPYAAPPEPVSPAPAHKARRQQLSRRPD